MLSSFRFVTRYLLALALFHLAGCSTMQTVNIANAMSYSPPPGVDYGSRVEVRTFDQRTAEFRVTEITPEGLGGNQGFYAYEDMRSLKVDRPGESNGNAVGWIIGVIGVAALVALIANADEVRVCSPSPCPTANP
jgi:hypothetical protein